MPVQDVGRNIPADDLPGPTLDDLNNTLKLHSYKKDTINSAKKKIEKKTSPNNQSNVSSKLPLRSQSLLDEMILPDLIIATNSPKVTNIEFMGYNMPEVQTALKKQIEVPKNNQGKYFEHQIASGISTTKNQSNPETIDPSPTYVREMNTARYSIGLKKARDQ